MQEWSLIGGDSVCKQIHNNKRDLKAVLVHLEEARRKMVILFLSEVVMTRELAARNGVITCRAPP